MLLKPTPLLLLLLHSVHPSHDTFASLLRHITLESSRAVNLCLIKKINFISISMHIECQQRPRLNQFVAILLTKSLFNIKWVHRDATHLSSLIWLRLSCIKTKNILCKKWKKKIKLKIHKTKLHLSVVADSAKPQNWV